MSVGAQSGAEPAPAGAHGDAEQDGSALAAVAELNASVRELAGGYLELAKIESLQAGLRLGIIVGIAFGIVILVVAAWLFVGWSLAFLLVDPAYLTWFVIGFALANLLLAGGLGFWAYKLIRQPLFAATRRQLRLGGPEGAQP